MKIEHVSNTFLNNIVFSIILVVVFPSITSATSSAALIKAALDRTMHHIQYDGSYHSINYPGGDVPKDIGVCTDVVIRSYRRLGIDLQELVHKDIKRNFTKYPSKKLWGLDRPDTNIDHRRVPNLQVFFTRNGQKLPITNKAQDYIPGDIVTWIVAGNLPHIGIVTDQYNSITGNPMIVHNIGRGPQLEDMLFSYSITGHYKYLP